MKEAYYLGPQGRVRRVFVVTPKNEGEIIVIDAKFIYSSPKDQEDNYEFVQSDRLINNYDEYLCAQLNCIVSKIEFKTELIEQQRKILTAKQHLVERYSSVDVELAKKRLELSIKELNELNENYKYFECKILEN